MNAFLLLYLTAICAGLIIWGSLRRGRVYEFPFLAALVFAGFVIPQLVGLSGAATLPSGGWRKTVIMTILCAGMCFLGYMTNTRPLCRFTGRYNLHRLVLVGSAFSVAGAYSFYQISRLPEELTGVAIWTGLPVAYMFFAQLLSYGFVISVFSWFAARSKLSAVIALADTVLYLDRIVIAGRRYAALEFVAILALSIWFYRRKAISWNFFVCAFATAVLLLYSTGEYRALTGEHRLPRLSDLSRIDFLGNLRRVMSQGGLELQNAVFDIAAVDSERQFDFGLFHWNTLVFNYIPGQLVGPDRKRSLMVGVHDPAFLEYGYVPQPGSTHTGMSDAFGSFWYFGCLKFFLIAYLMRRIYNAAMQGTFTMQILYALILTPSLHTITHHTQWFFSPWVHICLFLVPALLFARSGSAWTARCNRAYRPASWTQETQNRLRYSA